MNERKRDSNMSVVGLVKSWFVVDTVTDQGYGTYMAVSSDVALAAAEGDFDRDPVDGDVYHVYEVTGHLCPGVSIVWHPAGPDAAATLTK
jgi:hypothetical protein